MEILSQFLLRLAFGLAVGMAITSPQKVYSGFYRNHLYVTLGLTTLAALVVGSIYWGIAVPAVCAAILSYLGATCWLYEAKRPGRLAIVLVAWFSLLAAWIGSTVYYAPVVVGNQPTDQVLLTQGPLSPVQAIAIVTSGLVLGIVFAAMLLGHWYLNAPGMELAPLRRLIVVAGVAIVVQMWVVGAGLVAEWSYRPDVTMGWLLFVTLRWSFGLVGVLGLLWMAWQTLKIPNTQSATGILYVAVIGVFIGELTGLLLSAESMYPL